MAVKIKPTHLPVPGGDFLLSISDTCAVLKIGRTKCWSLIGTGSLEVVRLGNRCTRVRRSSIDRLIDNGGD
jgi:hypothetical protein